MAASQARDQNGRFVSVKWTGSATMQNRMQTLSKKFPHEVARALYIETEIEAKECKRRCPVDTGALRASIFVEGPVIEGSALGKDKIYTLIVCGGASAPYAIIVHENLTAYHKVGQAKFIESTLLESSPYMANRVANRIDLNAAASGA